jgi:hypothetical protein
MNITSKIGILATLLLVNTNLFAQEAPFKLGVRLGGGMSVNTGMGKILVPEDYYSNYNFKDKWQITPTVGVFAQYHVDGSIIGVEGGFSYWQKASQLVYNDNKELNYKVTPRYNYIGVSALLKIYPWRKGFNISIGGRAGANLNGKGISYESNQEESKFANYHFATVAETERLMKEKLTGQPDIAVGGGFGYEIDHHWAVDLRYFYGLNSTIKTEHNDYNWAEHATHSQNIELSVSYLFNL